MGIQAETGGKCPQVWEAQAWLEATEAGKSKEGPLPSPPTTTLEPLGAGCRLPRP